MMNQNKKLSFSIEDILEYKKDILCEKRLRSTIASTAQTLLEPVDVNCMYSKFKILI